MESRELAIERSTFVEILKSLSQRVAEDYRTEKELGFLGIQKRGSELLNLLKPLLKDLLTDSILYFGDLDITFFRDDYRKSGALLKPNTTHIPFSLEQKPIILVDDVLFTGRTVRAALDAMLAYGRPSSVKLLVLVDREGFRQLPIEAQYIGKKIITRQNQRIILDCENYQVWIVNHE